VPASKPPSGSLDDVAKSIVLEFAGLDIEVAPDAVVDSVLVVVVVVRGNFSNGTRRWHPTVGHIDG
jgi:hypothetical protein